MDYQGLLDLDQKFIWRLNLAPVVHRDQDEIVAWQSFLRSDSLR
jgi:hypothetical protein